MPSISSDRRRDSLAPGDMPHSHERPVAGDLPTTQARNTFVQSEARRRTPVFPRIGDELAGFVILLELGRGALCYFAFIWPRKSAWGRRQVAIKVSQPEGEEPRILARFAARPHRAGSLRMR